MFLEFISKKFQPELKLLLYSVSIHRDIEMDEQIIAILESDINWEDFVSLALKHGVIPLAYKTLSLFPQHIPSTQLDRLRRLTHANSHHNLYLTRELLKILSLLDSNGVKALPYKGPISAELIYGDLSLRQFSDLDILVSKKDVLKTKKLLHSIDYFPRLERSEKEDQFFLNNGRSYNYKFTSKDGQVLVELHWRFTSKFNSFLIDYDQIMENLTQIKIANKKIPILRLEELLVILGQHNSKHFWERLLWICDVATLIHRHNTDIDWERVILLSTDVGATRMVLLGLSLSQTLFNISLPDHISKKVASDSKVRKLTKQVIDQLTSNTENHIQGFERHIFSCDMRERMRDKIRYCIYHFMPNRLGSYLFHQKYDV